MTSYFPAFLASLLGIFSLGNHEAMKETKIKELNFSCILGFFITKIVTPWTKSVNEKGVLLLD
jgi:hypothetical protein